MEKIIQAIYKELKDKNATLDLIKSYVRVAKSISPFEFTKEEDCYMVGELVRRLSFNPLEEVNKF